MEHMLCLADDVHAVSMQRTPCTVMVSARACSRNTCSALLLLSMHCATAVDAMRRDDYSVNTFMERHVRKDPMVHTFLIACQDEEVCEPKSKLTSFGVLSVETLLGLGTKVHFAPFPALPGCMTSAFSSRPFPLLLCSTHLPAQRSCMCALRCLCTCIGP